MTIYCLTIAPLPEALAEETSRLLENIADHRPVALSITVGDGGGWEVSAHYAGMVSANFAAAALRSLSTGEATIAIAPLPEIDWVRRSLDGLGPVTAGRFFLHGSHHRLRRTRPLASLEIDAGTAFGTGHHATTRGCLLALDRLLKRGEPRSALDIGCGTGVLAIAFARATRRPALATDIDPEAVRVTTDNARRNQVGDLVRAVMGTTHRVIMAGTPYDIIFANILARPLVTLAPAIARLAGTGGTVVLSGLYGDQDRRVEASYRLVGFRRAFRIRLDDWSTLVLSRS
ncbi:MAG: 50S ribosomal protein L11 methyltransferase [Pseudomonadota bacterium]|nr:50S ribosomal protein L11 methyltransferase [Pseudomonadota bacterium]